MLISEFKVSLFYRISSRIARATQGKKEGWREGKERKRKDSNLDGSLCL